MREDLRLILFALKKATIEDAVLRGLSEFMVDCEWRGKVERQKEADTDTSSASFDQLREAATVSPAEINCRINCYGPWTDEEIETALEAGVKRIFLPMVKAVHEVEHFLKRINGRAEALILVETVEALKISPELAKMPLAGIYVGLNDLAISRGYKTIFMPLLDGTMDDLREVFADMPFGFGGVTFLGHGCPCPVELLLAEMHRLRCNFSFLRRSYYRDSKGKHIADELKKIQVHWHSLGELSEHESAEKKRQLNKLIERLP